MSKSCIKTETVLTMTNMTEPTELLAFKRQNGGYKVTVKISMGISVVLSYQSFPNFFFLREVRLLKWPVTIKNFCSRLIADGFAFSFGKHKSVERSLTFRAPPYWSRNTVYSSLHSSAHI